MDQSQPDPIPVNAPAEVASAPKKPWAAPQVEAVEFVSTQASPNPGPAYDFAFFASSIPG
jgi:hypothetical protein